MKIPQIACFLFIASSLYAGAGATEYGKNVEVKKVLVTGTTANGMPILYPKNGTPEVKVLMVDISPGAETGWHRHPLPAIAYVLSGSVTVELENGKRYTARAGESFAEVVGTRHNGRNTGREPVRILLTVIGQKGMPVTEK